MSGSYFENLPTPAPGELLPCPMCGGRVLIVWASYDWDPVSPEHTKFRCESCGALFEYSWRSDPYKYRPHAIEWWNTRSPAQPWICEGYDVDQLKEVAALLKEQQIAPEHLQQICENINHGRQVAEIKFTREMLQHLQLVLETKDPQGRYT